MSENFYLGLRIRDLREHLAMGRHSFAEKCGIKKGTLENIEMGRQRTTEELILAIGKNWPEYSYWLITGKTIPEAGQISPELDEAREKLQKVG